MTARIVEDADVYGIEFRCVDGVIEWRHNAEKSPLSSFPNWAPLTTTHRGRIVCELGWSPSRLRSWADLLENPADFPRELATSPGDLEGFHG